MNKLTTRLMAAALACASWIAVPTLHAQTYPDKSVKIVVPYPPGGGADILARAIGQKLGTQWGQTVVIDNKAGAGGSIGTDAVAKAPADGYTLLMAFDTLAQLSFKQAGNAALPLEFSSARLLRVQLALLHRRRGRSC